MYTVDNQMYDYDSPKNQSIRERFVQREVYALATSIVEYCLEQSIHDVCSPFTLDGQLDHPTKIECPYCGEYYEAVETTIDAEEDVTILETTDEDPEDRFLCPICLQGHPTIEAAKKCCSHSAAYICPECNSVVPIDDADVVVQDAMEWWFVTDWFAEKLADEGELVLESNDGCLYAWGRQCSGQAISMDSVIGEVCYKLQILEGQKYYREVV